MQFEMSEERRLLADTLNRYLSENYGWETRAATAYDPPYHSPKKWADLAELGIFHALAPEAEGGFGGAGFDVTTVFEALGRALCPEPMLPALMAARLLLAADASIDGLLSGEMRYAVAVGEADAPYGIEGLATEARQEGGTWLLRGRKSVVYGAQAAERILVAAQAGAGLGVFEVKAVDVEVAGYGLIDGGGAGEVLLDDTPATLLIGDADAALQDALDFGALALCAEAVGVLDHMFETTLDYLKTRKQFGRSIGSFQALQHRMVDLKTEIEQARSITILAASRMGTDQQSRSVSMAKNLIGRTVKLTAEEAVQMHGGIAMTWEYPLSHYAKRAVMIDHQLGDTDYHLEQVMAAYRAA
ncbi:acyl-CoA dehydrogenase [Stappia sp. GBMRC 2046]|uniref:Acyl-CoA dehydrogenase n=1 Tax=Stappia sediminis TaxID=2692190 RepID=A0A7X3S8Y2_9HYPH|nr:acyl-CoA dehydrogenase [Stappia sediminis]MXN66346.1 acyl-CoA dehydrogenase [Stappia sediminis]